MFSWCFFYFHFLPIIYSVGGGHDRNLEVMSAALSSLKAYDQRLMFACGRLEMLKG